MKRWFLVITIIGVAALATGLGVLIWWLVDGRHNDYTTIILEGDGLGDIENTAAFTRISNVGDVFWWFFPSEGSGATSRPLILWLDGLTGLPPSFLANFAMFGPLDFNMNRRNGSWVEEFNLLFVDSPVGTGFSTASSDDNVPINLDDNTDHLLMTLESFFSVHEEYQDTPLYIFGQGDGAQIALSLAHRLSEGYAPFSQNLKGVVIGNGVVSPALTLTELGFYLDEMGYIDPSGRVVVEQYTTELNNHASAGRLSEAFDMFLGLGEFINDEVGTVAVNLRHILQKLTTSSRDTFGHLAYLRSALQIEIDFDEFMTRRVAPAVGISATTYDERREAAQLAFREVYMQPVTELVEKILENSEISVTIYNGNLDAISNTPGQLKWVNQLQWSGAEQFRNAPRQTLVVNGLVEGYFRESGRLIFYWFNAAGVSVPLDSPIAMRRVLQRITEIN